MKRLGLMICVLAVAALCVLAPVASAVTKSEAGAISNTYAVEHWGVGDVEHCEASGKNEAGKAQYYCYGYDDQWKVNVGPYGEITYAGLS